MVSEKRQLKKSVENKKSNNKEGKHKIKRIKIFLRCFFFEQKQRDGDRRNKILVKAIEKKNDGKMFLKIMHGETNLQQKW